MTKKMYSIKDNKAEMYHVPFYANTHAEAERNVTTVVNDEKTSIGQYPKDFDLYFLGEFNDNLGKFDLLPAPQHMCECITMVKKDHQKLASV